MIFLFCVNMPHGKSMFFICCQAVLHWFNVFSCENSWLLHQFMRFWYDWMIWGRDQDSWTITKAQGSMPGSGFRWCSPGFGLQKHAHMFLITLTSAESQVLSMSLCDFDMIGSSWSGPRAHGPLPGPRAHGSGLVAHVSVVMGQGHLAIGQSAEVRGQSSWPHGLFSRPWILNLGCKNLAICLWISWNSRNCIFELQFPNVITNTAFGAAQVNKSSRKHWLSCLTCKIIAICLRIASIFRKVSCGEV